MVVSLHDWLPQRGKAQMACNLIFPQDNNILNKFIIWKEKHLGCENHTSYSLNCYTKNSSY